MAVILCESKYFLIMVILMLIQEAIAQEDVSPSCSSQSCRTLSQIPSLTSSHLSLILLPGNHTINSSLSFVNKTDISLKGIYGEVTFVRCTINDGSVNIQFQGSSRVSIKKITFHRCSLSIFDSNNINASNVRLLNAYNRVLWIYNSFNITIDRSHFDSNQEGCDVLKLSRSKNFAITRSKLHK